LDILRLSSLRSGSLATIATGAFGIAMGGNFVWMAIAVALGGWNRQSIMVVMGLIAAVLAGLPVATAIYLLAYRSFDLKEEIRLIAIADHQLDPDA